MFVCVLQRIYYRVYWMLNYYGTHVWVSRRVCYYVAANVKLLWIVWMSNFKDITMLKWFHKPHLECLIGWWLALANGILSGWPGWAND
jgi:hypothetical protein